MDAIFRVEWDGNKLLLPADEIKHAVKVLRMRPGDKFVGIDGKGQFIVTKLSNRLSNDKMIIPFDGYLTTSTEPTIEIELIVPLLTERDRLEWMVEKVTELGATRIVLCRYERSTAQRCNMIRIEKILWASMKQCQRARLPEVYLLNSVCEYISSRENNRNILACTCDNLIQKKLLNQISWSTSNVTWIIGPEGDLSLNEINQLNEIGVTWVSLGSARLRAETAAIHVLSFTKSQLGY